MPEEVRSEYDRVRPRDEWLFGTDYTKFELDKIIRYYIRKMLIKTQQMFEYENLPDTIPKKDYLLIKQTHGSVTIAKADDGNLYAFRAGLGGKPNAYYLPTLAIVANPGLNFNKTFEIDKDCVVILNDAMYAGLMPIIEHNAYLLAQCDISFKYACVNIRIPALIDAPNDTAKAEAEAFLKKVEEGKGLGVIADETFLDKLSVYNYANSDTSITHLIELKQYIWGTFLQEIGIQSTFNMKREAINEAEAGMSEDILIPSVDEMLEQEQIGWDKVNKMFGTNVKVRLSSVWENVRKKRELAEELTESEIDKNLQSGSEEPQNEENGNAEGGDDQKNENI